MGIPLPIKIFFYVEACLFGPFSLHHYLSCTDRKQLKHLTSNRVAWLIIHSGEMLNGVGAWIVMFVVLDALVKNEVSTLALEVVMLAHSLWMGMIFAYWPLAKEAALLHLPLTAGIFAVSWSFVPTWSILLDVAVMLYAPRAEFSRLGRPPRTVRGVGTAPANYPRRRSRVAATRPNGLSASPQRRRRDPPKRTIRVAAAASPRPVPARLGTAA